MRKLVASAALSLAMIVGSAFPSAAVTWTVNPTSLGSFPNPSGTSTSFDNPDVLANGSGDAFTNVFSFFLTQNASIETALVTNSAAGGVGFIQNFAMNLYDTVVSPGTLIDTAIVVFTNPLVGTALLQDTINLLAGHTYLLVLTGNVPGAAAGTTPGQPDYSYGGSITFTFPPGQNDVPLPGALLLMATALLGSAGVAKWRRGRIAA